MLVMIFKGFLLRQNKLLLEIYACFISNLFIFIEDLVQLQGYLFWIFPIFTFSRKFNSFQKV